MKINVFFGFLIALFLIIIPNSSTASADQSVSNNPIPYEGVLDLRHLDWKNNEIISLDGEWEFYWNELIAPNEFAHNKNPSYVNIPNTWNQYPIEQISNQGFGTYRLLIYLPTDYYEKRLGFYLPSVATAYKIWVNNNLIGSNGAVGVNREEMVAENYPKVAYYEPDSNELEVIIQVSNFVQRKGGLWDTILLGTADDVSRKYQLDTMYQVFIVGSLVIMAFYHFILFLTRRKDRSTLYFGILCALVGIRTLFTGQTIAVNLFPAISWEIAVKMEYLTVFNSLFLLVLFISSQYKKEMKLWFVTFTKYCTLFLSLFVIFTPAILYTKILYFYNYGILIPTVFYILYVYYLVFKCKKEGYLLNVVGIAFLSVTMINDVFYYSHLTSIGDLFPIGLLMFLFIQSINLAVKFSKAFIRVEKLSYELVKLNESLEEKVKQRTSELQKTNLTLEKANLDLTRKEEFRKRLLANISHELMTPLTSLKGYVIAIIDRIVASDDPKYWRIIQDKVVFLEHMIEDLFELTKLETKQIRFHFQEEEVISYFKSLYQKYELSVRREGIIIQFNILNDECCSTNNGEIAVFNIDRVRVEQVFSNILINAQKNTPVGGEINIELKVVMKDERKGMVMLKIKDSGRGIPSSETKNIFDRYYSRSNSGLGLGLAICKEIISYHYGQIGVDSIEGNGSTFYFSLPFQCMNMKEVTKEKGGTTE